MKMYVPGGHETIFYILRSNIVGGGENILLNHGDSWLKHSFSAYMSLTDLFSLSDLIPLSIKMQLIIYLTY